MSRPDAPTRTAPLPRLAPRSDPQLQFVEEVALPPPEVQIDLAEQERNERELERLRTELRMLRDSSGRCSVQ